MWGKIIVYLCGQCSCFHFVFSSAYPTGAQINNSIHESTLLMDSFSDKFRDAPQVFCHTITYYLFNLCQNSSVNILLIFSLKSIVSYRERILPLAKHVLCSKLYKCFNGFCP